ncbi:MAG TPA: CUB domain-containing protein [Thermoanaerobaculia bacterium]|jgi:hypothetical protein|nr:CUB domain-containing protein [Thermoanaerobaculia bacterium]
MTAKVPFTVLLLTGCALATAARAEFRISNSPISACSGSFTDTGGPTGSYSPGELLVETIWPSRPNSRVELSFTAFESASSSDRLQVYNGHNTFQPRLLDLSGPRSPISVESTATDGSLTLQWTVASTTAGPGWKATIGCLPTEQRMREAAAEVCSADFTDSGGTAGPYSSFESSDLIVYPAQSDAQLAVAFSSFDLEPGLSDRLYVYDGAGVGGTPLGVYSGSSLPPNLHATNLAGALTFHFVSDGTVVGAGWQAQLYCVQPIKNGTVSACGGVSTDSGGTDGPYGNGELRTQTIAPTELGGKVELTFVDFDSEAGFDTLSIYDGADTTAPLLGTLSGGWPGTAPVFTSSSGPLTLQWSSDGALTGRGWAAAINCVYPIDAGPVTTCRAIAVDTGGRGAAYRNDESFAQTFTRARPFAQMGFTVSEFNSEADFDFLRVRDGLAGSAQIGALTGVPAVPVSFRATNSQGNLTLDWSTDFSNVRSGWWGTVACIVPLFADGFESRDAGQWAFAVP